MADLKWSSNSPLRVLGAVAVAGLYGVWPAIQNWGDPLLVAMNLVFASYFALTLLRDGRLTTSGHQVNVSSALRTRRVQAQEIAGIVRSTEMPWTLMIWTLDGQFIRTAAPRHGFHDKNAVPRRLAELEAWFVEHRGADWTLDSLVRA